MDGQLDNEQRAKEEIQAEIDVLLELPGDKSNNANERLSAILKRSPEQLTELMGRSQAPETIENLAILLPRLGAKALRLILSIALDTAPVVSTNAGQVLCKMAARSRPIHKQGWHRGTASREGYLSEVSEVSKAELLVDLAEVCEDDTTAALFVALISCWPQGAFPFLMERFLASAGAPADTDRSPIVLHALCRQHRHDQGRHDLHGRYSRQEDLRRRVRHGRRF